MRRLLCLLLVALPSGLQAHEVRPAVLRATETVAGVFQVVWKQPLLDDRRLPIEPRFPDGCEPRPAAEARQIAGALVQTWQIRCTLRSGTLEVDGLTSTLSDVMVQIRYLDDEPVNALLRPARPRLDLGGPAPSTAAYFALGVQHLLLGIDHLLFLVGLVLFIREPWSLVKTITAFTAAHSVTLALSVFGVVTLPSGPVEAVIALSILFLARELMLAPERRSELLRVRPWVMAFCFGLLHGFGFAGALVEIGLPRDQLAAALLLFNLGIEAGQLAVVALLLAAAWGARRVASRAAPSPQQAPLLPVPLLRDPFTRGLSVLMGCVAGLWTIERIVALV